MNKYPPQCNITTKAINGLLWMFSGAIVQSLLRLLVVAVLARLIVPAEFGLVGAAMLFIGMFSLIGELGVGQAIVQLPDVTEAHISAGFFLSIVCGITLGLILIASAGLCSSAMGMPALEEIIKVLAITFPIKGFSTVSNALLSRHMQFRTIALVEICSYFFGFGLVGIFLAFLNYGVWALVTAHVIQTLLFTIISIFIQRHNLRLQIDSIALKELLKLGSGFTLARIGNYIALQGDYFIVGRCLGEIALGLYIRAYHLMVLPVVLFGKAIDQVLFSAMAKKQSNNDALVVAFQRGTSLVTLLSLFTSVILIFFSHEIFRIVFGPAWSFAIPPFEILALGMVFRTGYKISESVIRAIGAVYNYARSQWVYGGFVVVGSLIGQYWGIVGVSWGILLAVTVNYLIMLRLVVSNCGIRWRDLLSLYSPGIHLSLAVIGLLWLLSDHLRVIFKSDIIVLLVGVSACVILSIFLMVCFPKYFLGSECLWIVKSLNNLLPSFISKKR